MFAHVFEGVSHKFSHKSKVGGGACISLTGEVDRAPSVSQIPLFLMVLKTSILAGVSLGFEQENSLRSWL